MQQGRCQAPGSESLKYLLRPDLISGVARGSSEIDRKDGGISKTVEFEFQGSAV